MSDDLLSSSTTLNRLSWLRPSQSFLNTIIQLPTTRWILFNNGKHLIIRSQNNSKPTSSLAYLTTQDVEPLLGQKPYFGQAKDLGDLIPDTKPTHDEHHFRPTESIRHRGPRVVFLGLHETGERDANSLPSSDFTDPESTVQKLQGTPYFSMDISSIGLKDDDLHRFLGNTILGQKGNNLIWSEPKPLSPWLDAFAAGVFASARSMVDWNQRNKV